MLYSDSLVAWYPDQESTSASGGVRVSDSPDLIAAGQYAGRIPARPSLPPGCLLKQVIAIGSRASEHVNWLVTKSEKDITEWMTAIGGTLPPPPGVPGQQPQAYGPPQQGRPGPPPGYPAQMG